MRKLFENWRKYVKEDLAPGSNPNATSGIPVGTDDNEEMMSVDGKPKPKGAPEPGPDRKEKTSQSILQNAKLDDLAAMFSSLHSLYVSSNNGEHRHLVKDSKGKPVLRSAQMKLWRIAKQRGISAQEFRQEVKAHSDWKLANGIATNPYIFSREEISNFRNSIKNFDDYSEKMLRGKFTNVEAYINMGMPYRDMRERQFGASASEMRALMQQASIALEATGFPEYAIDGQKSFFAPREYNRKRYFNQKPAVAAPSGRRVGK